METQLKKISLDVLIKYIKDNISIVENTDIVIESKSEKKSIPLKKEKIIQKEKTFIEEFIDAQINTSIRFPKLKKIFSNDLLNDFLIYKVDEDNSFYRTLFTILESNFSLQDKEKQDLIIKNFIQYLKSDITMLGFAQYEYAKLKFNKKLMYNDIDKNIISKEILRYCADVFHINIFYIDYKDETINYSGGNFIPFKKSIILLKINDQYAICQTEQNKIFRFNNNAFFDKILLNPEHIKLLTCDKFNICTEDLNKYIKKNKTESKKIQEIDTNIDFDKIMEKNKKSDSNNNINKNNVNSNINGYDSDDSKDDSIDDSKDDEKKSPIKDKKIQHIDESINENMSLSELQKLAKEKNIAITVIIDGKKKIKNKKDLCKEILGES